MRHAAAQRGFTLIELVITLDDQRRSSWRSCRCSSAAPVQGFTDQARRARLVDAADTALERIGRDVRRGVAEQRTHDDLGAASWRSRC